MIPSIKFIGMDEAKSDSNFEKQSWSRPTPNRREETERPDEVFQLLAFQRDELRENTSEGKREKSYKIRSSQRLSGRGRSVSAADGRSTGHTHGVLDNTEYLKKVFPGCVISPARPEAGAHNLRKCLLGFFVLADQDWSLMSLWLRYHERTVRSARPILFSGIILLNS